MRLRSPWVPRLSERGTILSDRLADALAGDILQGTLDAGARLPAHRDLADTLGIGVGTVTKAYALLERRGLVRTARGAGTFVALSAVRSGPLIDLSRNAPPPALTDRLLARTLSAVARRIDAGLFNDYPPPGGHAEHRRLLARWFASLGMHADPDLLLLANGAHHAIAIAFTLACGQGGTLLTEAHTYPGALALARHQGLRVVGIGMDEEGILPAALDRALGSLGAMQRTRSALYVTPTLHNPTTATMRRARRDAVVAVCRAHDIAIVEDDVYNLGIDPEGVPLAMLAPERTLYANSLSKSLNPTLRIGALVVPPAWREAAESMLRASAVMVSPLSCAVMEQWLLDGTADAVSRAIQQESAQRLALARSALGERIFLPAGPGYHAWMPMAAAQAVRLYDAAAACGIRLTPPGATAAGDAPERAPGGLRLCLGTPSMPDLAAALETLARLAEAQDSALTPPA